MYKILVLLLTIASGLQAFAQGEMPKPAYDFSLSREERLALAESAAPPEISAKATVYLLERSGYVKVRDGSNGFSCIVDRQTPWNCEPTCFDAEGTATTLPARLFVEEQRAKGKTEEQIKADLDAGYKNGKFKAPGKAGIVYMMSDRGVLLVPGNKLVHIPPHLMFYAPYAPTRTSDRHPQKSICPVLSDPANLTPTSLSYWEPSSMTHIKERTSWAMDMPRTLLACTTKLTVPNTRPAMALVCWLEHF